MCGKPNNSNKIRLLTLANVDGEHEIEIEFPNKSQRLTPGEPTWANYVKGVIEHFPGEHVWLF